MRGRNQACCVKCVKPPGILGKTSASRLDSSGLLTLASEHTLEDWEPPVWRNSCTTADLEPANMHKHSDSTFAVKQTADTSTRFYFLLFSLTPTHPRLAEQLLTQTPPNQGALICLFQHKQTTVCLCCMHFVGSLATFESVAISRRKRKV